MKQKKQTKRGQDGDIHLVSGLVSTKPGNKAIEAVGRLRGWDKRESEKRVESAHVVLRYLENRCGRESTGGSNPFPSALQNSPRRAPTEGWSRERGRGRRSIVGPQLESEQHELNE